MASNAPTKAPWDQRLAERLARESWEAANDPTLRRNPPLREQIRSPYYWFSCLALIAAAILVWRDAKPTWIHALTILLYLLALLASVAARRNARATDLRRRTTKQ
jgi:hypothetical protein